MGVIPATVSERARSRILGQAVQNQGSVGVMLSIAKGKGCGGNEYKWGAFVQSVPEGHEQIKVSDDFSIFVPLIDSLNMFGMTIDFGPDENGKNIGSECFRFINPNESGRCGCGASVTFKSQP
ncbi:MAG: hypothetical protein HYS17_08400 [Micavibrio aeruginosavorus]|uniref:Iron-sulfur cluster assembly accessory protein n=1 Tax=Micavibrio aeruginosavorus TaxID=349221 RepID=A0A7T5R108_9BACT|nr:MAG: hypothetical protein HYS17_08400 [Micavibrio aeruginosavorus]